MKLIDDLKFKMAAKRIEIAKTKAQEKKDKEFLKKIELEAKEEEKELSKEAKDPGIGDLFNLLKEDDEIDIGDFSKEELEELEAEKKFEKKMLIAISSTISVIIILLVVAGNVLTYMGLSDEDKVTKPLMIDYYKNKYNEVIKIDKVNKLCSNGSSNEVICSDILVGNTLDNKHIITLDNENFGDDVDYIKASNDYDNYLNTFVLSSNLVNHFATLSYNDYYLNYSKYLDYINVLPNGLDFNGLVGSGKLTINDVIVYQNEIDVNGLYNFVNSLSDDSVLYLIEVTKGIPNKLTVLSKNSVVEMNVNASTNLRNGIVYYEFDRNINSVTSLTIKDVLPAEIDTSDEDFIANTNSYEIQITTASSYSNDKKPFYSYYLLGFDQNKLKIPNDDNLILFSSSGYNNKHSLIEKDSVNNFNYFSIGGTTFVLSDMSYGVSTIGAEQSWLCKLNLC